MKEGLYGIMSFRTAGLEYPKEVAMAETALEAICVALAYTPITGELDSAPAARAKIDAGLEIGPVPYSSPD